MDYKTIGDIYGANDKILKRFVETVRSLSDEQAALQTENGKWTVEHLVEHVAVVYRGMTGISAKLLSKAEAEGKTSDGSAHPSGTFMAAVSNAGNQKFDAPEAVAPKGDKSISESLDLLDRSKNDLDALREKFESVSGTEAFFPHPAFGQLNAHDWLILVGEHVARHNAQLHKILENN
ncbi:MAG: DinB family protein [Pyrinomonadaceae bacterium]